MSDWNLNVSGDLNIYVPAMPQDAQSAKALLAIYGQMAEDEATEELRALCAFLKDFIEDCEARSSSDEEKADDEDNCATAMVVRPGKPYQVMELADCEVLLDRFGTHRKTVTLPTLDEDMIFDERQVLELNGEQYLFGPAIIVNRLIDFRPDMDCEDIRLAKRVLEERTVTLCADGQDFSAIRL